MMEAPGFEMTSSLSRAMYNLLNKAEAGTGYTQELGEARQSLLLSPTCPLQKLEPNGRKNVHPNSTAHLVLNPAVTSGCKSHDELLKALQGSTDQQRIRGGR